MERRSLIVCLFFLRLISFEVFQVVDLQVFATPRITLKPLVPSFPCFAKICVSLMAKVSDDCHYYICLITYLYVWKILLRSQGCRVFGADKSNVKFVVVKIDFMFFFS